MHYPDPLIAKLGLAAILVRASPVESRRDHPHDRVRRRHGRHRRLVDGASTSLGRDHLHLGGRQGPCRPRPCGAAGVSECPARHHPDGILPNSPSFRSAYTPATLYSRSKNICRGAPPADRGAGRPRWWCCFSDASRFTPRPTHSPCIKPGTRGATPAGGSSGGAGGMRLAWQ